MCPQSGPQIERTVSDGVSFIFVAYNPSIHEIDMITFTLPYSTFTIQIFNETSNTFGSAALNPRFDFDTFCHDNSDHTLECEVIV